MEGQLAFWMLGTGIGGEARRGHCRAGLPWGRAELRNFLTLCRVILDNRCMGAVNIWDVGLPCLLSLARWPAFGRKENSKVKGSSDKETGWGGDFTHPLVGG